MKSETIATIRLRTKNSQHPCNRVSFTEEDFMERNFRDPLFDRSNKLEEGEYLPPADKGVFDSMFDHHLPSEYLLAGFESNIRTNRQDAWIVPPPVASYDFPIMSSPSSSFDADDNDRIQVPSLDANLKWSPQNPIMTLPKNIRRTHLAHAVTSGEVKTIHGAQMSILEELKRMTHVQMAAKASSTKKHTELIPESKITDRDVICERGGRSNRHIGTKRYRGMIEQYKPEYQSLMSKTAKTNLSRKVITQIKNNGGRFLKRDEDSQQYFVLSQVETTKKVSQAMREKKTLKWTSTSISADEISSSSPSITPTKKRVIPKKE